MTRAELAPSVSNLPFHERMLAYEDFDAAFASRRLAHYYRRTRGLGWAADFHLEMRRAIRAWHNYAKAVRKSAQVTTRRHAA